MGNVITDAGGRYIVSGVPITCGPLIAAAPTLLAQLQALRPPTRLRIVGDAS